MEITCVHRRRRFLQNRGCGRDMHASARGRRLVWRGVPPSFSGGCRLNDLRFVIRLPPTGDLIDALWSAAFTSQTLKSFERFRVERSKFIPADRLDQSVLIRFKSLVGVCELISGT